MSELTDFIKSHKTIINIIADKAGITASTIYNLGRGDLTTLIDDRIDRVAKALKVDRIEIENRIPYQKPYYDITGKRLEQGSPTLDQQIKRNMKGQKAEKEQRRARNAQRNSAINENHVRYTCRPKGGWSSSFGKAKAGRYA